MDRDAENFAVLMLVRSMLGWISREIHAVSIEFTRGNVVLHFAVRERTVQVEQDIGEIVDEMESDYYSLPNTHPPVIESVIYEGLPDYEWVGRGHGKRPVYLSKEAYIAVASS